MMGRQGILHGLGMLVFVAAMLGVFWPATHSYFDSDDWTLLWFYAREPLWRLDLFFSPHAVWFYRPLQAVQLSALYHLFGLKAAAYGVVQIAMHLVTCALGALLVKRVTRSNVSAWITVILFGWSWIFADVLLWKSNINTLQWAIVSLGACLAYVRWLETGSRAWYVAAIAAAALDLFTKESAVALPLLLAVLAGWKHLESGSESTNAVVSGRREVTSLLPFAALSVGYAIAHSLLFRNIDPDVTPDYQFASPLLALGQWLHAINHTLFGWTYPSTLLSASDGAWNVVDGVLRRAYILPPALALIFWRLRLSTALGGLAFAAAALLPTVFLKNYHASRYYYVAALGGAIMWAGLFSAMVEAYRRHRESARHRYAVLAAAVLLAMSVASNLLNLREVLVEDQQAANRLRAGFQVLQKHSTVVPAESLVVLQNLPSGTMDNGRGARYYVRFALNDPAAEAASPGQNMSKAQTERLNQLPNRFLLDYKSQPPGLFRITAGESGPKLVPVEATTTSGS